VKVQAQEAEPYVIKVYDQIGKLQFQEKFTPVAGTDIHTLHFSKGAARQPGVYLVVVENESQHIRKVIRVLKSR
jgi:hypothetical protein